MDRHFPRRRIYHSNQRVIPSDDLGLEIFLETINKLIFGLLLYLNLPENAIEFSERSGNTNK